MAALLNLENISKYYTSAQSVALGLNHVSLSFQSGEFVAVTGESGSGKSTLGKVLAGILPYEDGEMYINGNPTSHYGHSEWEQYRIGYVSFISQEYDILPGCSVLENVVSVLLLMGIGREDAVAEAERVLGQVELLQLKTKKAAKLSSGQKQRLSIARALAKPAPVLIADEPTGNLDGENGEKIVRMLAEAAEGRLVVIITHNYNEVEKLVSRHIIVRSGMIDSDAVLRPAAEGVPERPEAKTGGRPDGRLSRKLNRYIARLQISSSPVKSAGMLCLMMLTAFSLFVFLGTFVVNLDDSFTRRYDDSAFLNGGKTRIVAARSDDTDMTDGDFEAILGLPYVAGIEKYGFVSDINYYYRENIDYRYHYITETDSSGTPTGYIHMERTLEETGLFVQTIPFLPSGSVFLTAGRLPENMYEVVAAGGEDLIGDEITVYISNRRNWMQGSYICFDVTVVGVTDRGEHLYFDRQLGRVLTGEYAGGKYVVAPDYKQTPGEMRFLFSSSMYNSLYQVVMERQSKVGGIEYARIEEDMYKEEYVFPDYGNPEGEIVLTPFGKHISTLRNYILTNPEVFERITPDTHGKAISVYITDYAYTEQVLEGLAALGYHAVSPYRIGTTAQDEILAAERLRTLKICILAAVAVFLLQIIVLRVMFGMETEGYRLLANLGLRRDTARWSVIWQLAAFTLGGQLLAAAAVLTGSLMGEERICHVLKYLPVPYIMQFMLMHLAAGLLASLWVAAAMDRQIFPSNPQYADLKLDDGEDM